MEQTNPEQKLEAAPAVLQMTVSITRKATGKVETYQLVGTPVPPEPEKEPE